MLTDHHPCGRELVVEPHFVDALEVLAVSSDENQVVMQGGRCNEKIRRRDEQSSCAELTTHACIALSNPSRYSQHLDTTQKMPEYGLVLRLFVPIADALKDFGVSDDADCDPLGKSESRS
jgi:hypothetical protein